MFSLIQNLQRKPRQSRQRIAFFVALFITFLIILIWFSTVDTRLFEEGDVRVEQYRKSPLETIGERFRVILENLEERLGTIKERGETN